MKKNIKPRIISGKNIYLFKKIRLALVIIVLLSAAGLSVFIIIRVRNSINAEKREILRLWNAQNYESVYNLSKDLLDQYPVDYFLLTMYGFSSFQIGISQINNQDTLNYINESIFSLRKAMIHNEGANDGRLFYILGKAYGYKGNEYADLAVKYLEKSLASGFEAYDIPEFLGLSYASFGDYRNSVSAFSRALSGDRTPSDNMLISIARSYMAMEEYAQAASYLQRCVEFSPDSRSIITARMLLAEIYIATGNLETAEQQYLTILDDSGGNAEVHFQLGELYYLRGDAVRARSEWRSAIWIDPTHSGARSRMNYQ